MLRDELNKYYKPNQLLDFNLVGCDRKTEFVMKRLMPN